MKNNLLKDIKSLCRKIYTSDVGILESYRNFELIESELFKYKNKIEIRGYSWYGRIEAMV